MSYLQQYRTVFFYFCLIFFSSCQSDLDFSTEVEPEPSPIECLKKTINGQEICVEQRIETFHVQKIEDKLVDFLFVLDVSPSMTNDLSRLGQAFESLMSQIHQSQWQIFFTTADHGDHDYSVDLDTDEKIFDHLKWEDYSGNEPFFGYFMHLEYQGKKMNQQQLNSETPDYINVFKDTLTRKSGDDCSLAPYCQGSLEQPLRVLNSSLERLAQSKTPILRESADFVSFIVTDEDERVEDPNQATKASEVLKTFNTLFPKKSFYSFGLLIQDEQCLTQQKNHSPQAVYGEKVSELASLTQGKNVSLCEEDYGPDLEELSRLLRIFMESVKLKEKPISPEIQVQFIKGKRQTGWKLEGNKLMFKKALEPGSEIKVSYFVKTKQ